MAMMTRTARGHTARPLQVGSAETISYGLVAVAALARATAPYLSASAYWPALFLSAGALATAFATYTCVYARWLISERLDGQDG